jgi:hypothetical protein
MYSITRKEVVVALSGKVVLASMLKLLHQAVKAMETRRFSSLKMRKPMVQEKWG